jgi:hypothetical protein
LESFVDKKNKEKQMIKNLLPWTSTKKNQRDEGTGWLCINELPKVATLQGNASLKWWRAMMAGDGWASLWICPFTNDDWAFHQCY